MRIEAETMRPSLFISNIDVSSAKNTTPSHKKGRNGIGKKDKKAIHYSASASMSPYIIMTPPSMLP